MFARLSFVFLLSASNALSAEPQRIAVLSAFQPELKAVEAQMVPEGTPVQSSVINGTRFEEVDLNGHHFIFGLTGQSMVNAALNTQLMIDRLHVDAVVFCGIAGDVIIPAEWIHQMESVWANPDPEHPGHHILTRPENIWTCGQKRRHRHDPHVAGTSEVFRLDSLSQGSVISHDPFRTSCNPRHEKE